MEVAGGGLARAQPVAMEQVRMEKLNPMMLTQMNLESVKARALGLHNAISRILEQIDVYSRSNFLPKWQDMLGQFSMVNLELFNIVEDIKKVSKTYVVHPRNVNGENAPILPVMLSSKLLPEMEAEDNTKREQLLYGITSLPVTTQIEKLKNRIDMIAVACETAEKVIADARKQYGLGTRQGSTVISTLDKMQVGKIQEQENQLRAAVNVGDGLKITGDQRHHPPSSLPSHLVGVLNIGDGAPNFAGDNSGGISKTTPQFSSNNVTPQGTMLQTPGAQLVGRSAPSPSGGPTSFDNATTPPLSYANSPRSGTNMMNTPSPQQQSQQQQRQKLLQVPPQQLLTQQLRQSSATGVLGQNAMLQDLQGQNQSKFNALSGHHPIQYSQPLTHQFPNRQLPSAHMPHNLVQSQLTQGNPLRSHLSQFTGSANGAMFNHAQTSPASQMISNMSANMSATMQSPSLLPRMQFGLPGANTQRNISSQMLSDQMFGMGVPTPASMAAMQQQQGGYGNMSAQSLHPSMMGLQNVTQNPNYPQQRQQNNQQ